MVRKIRQDEIWWCDNHITFDTAYIAEMKLGFFVLNTYEEIKPGKLALSLKKGKRRVLVSGEVVHHRNYHRDGISDATFFITKNVEKLRNLL